MDLRDNFFDRGGNSLLMAQVKSKLEKQYNRKYPDAVFLASITITMALAVAFQLEYLLRLSHKCSKV